MIATRFRSVYWVGGVAVAALGCYLVSQRVAAERATLTRTEAAIVSGKRDIRALQTEILTRAGMNQIERWNADVLSLSAPKASQFLASEVQLAALVQPVQPAMDAPAAVIPAAVAAPPRPVPMVTTVSYTAPAPAPRVEPASDEPAPRRAAVKLASADAPIRRPAAVRFADDDASSRQPAHVSRVSFAPAARPAPRRLADDAADDAPRIRPAVYLRPGREHQNVALLDDKLLGDIDRIAASERQGGKRSR